MTLILIALWIAGHHFEWFWLLGAVALDVIWFSIKLNFLTVLMRRSVQEALLEVAEAANETTPPAPPSA